MQAATPAHTSAALPPGYRTVSLEPEAAGAALRICVLVKEAPDPVGGPLVLLGDVADASIYLGCLADAAGFVHEWLEIAVQNLDHLAERFPTHGALFSNAALDRQWRRRAEVARSLDPEAFIATGWEIEQPRPLFLTLSLEGALHPRDESTGEPWRLCTEDAALEAAGLPTYSTSLARYLIAPTASGEVTRFIPVAAEAASNERTVPVKKALGNLFPFNAAAGLMTVRKLAPLTLDEWFDVLGGKPWRGIEHGKKPLRFPGIYRTLSDTAAITQGTGHLLLAAHGRMGRMLEAFHLKLQTLRAAFSLAREWIAQEQLPFLNLSSDSFRVRLGESDQGLPFLWQSQTTLARAGEALALPVDTSEARYFAPAAIAAGASIYRPTALGAPVRGTGTLRLRTVEGGDGGAPARIEGTLVTEERIAVAANDLLSLQLALPSGRIELYGRWDANESLASRELRFRTLPRPLSPAALTALREAGGAAIPHVGFETLPVLSTPCDLHALAVIGVRALLVDAELSLPVALDELLSFGKVAAESADGSTPLHQRLASLAASDPKWQNALGPHRLLQDALAPEDAAARFPLDLWWETLALLVRCFPGLGPDSFCHDYGDAPALALERIFDEPLITFDALLRRSRSLLVVDWNQNREIRSVVDAFLSRVL